MEPELRSREMLQSGLQRPASNAASARLPAASKRPARMSASIWRSHWSAAYAANHAESRESSSADKRGIVRDQESPLASGVLPARAAGSAGSMSEVPKGWRCAASLRWALYLILAVVACQQTSKRQIFIKIGPMQAERRHLDIVQLISGALGKSRVATDWKTHLHTTVHRDHNVTVSECGCFRGINQGVHAKPQ